MRSIGFLNRYFSELAKIVANGAKWAPVGTHENVPAKWSKIRFGKLCRSLIAPGRFRRLHMAGTDICGPYKSIAASLRDFWLRKTRFFGLAGAPSCKSYCLCVLTPTVRKLSILVQIRQKSCFSKPEVAQRRGNRFVWPTNVPAGPAEPTEAWRGGQESPSSRNSSFFGFGWYLRTI